jgi:hypothetical protein
MVEFGLFQAKDGMDAGRLDIGIDYTDALAAHCKQSCEIGCGI